MGPYATVAFYERVLQLTNAQNDKDHIRLIIDSNTHIPSRNRHFIYDEESPVNGMMDAIMALKKLTVDVVYVPCNSATYFIDLPFREKVGVPIFGPIEVVLDHILSDKQQSNKVAVWGSHIIFSKKPYKQRLIDNGLNYVEHTSEEQLAIENIIYSVKQNKISKTLVFNAQELLNNFLDKYNMDILVLGCTELCLVFNSIKSTNVRVLDSNLLLAKHLVQNYK